jgi:chromosomal replication initiator protein
MYLCREYTSVSLDDIGKKMGKRDHSTIMHGINKIKDDLEHGDAALKEAIDLLGKKINA